MTEALTRAELKPRIDHPEELGCLVDQIVTKVEPSAIYLFGSRARGDAGENSDYDLLIVVPDSSASFTFPTSGDGPARFHCHTSTHSRFCWRQHIVGTLEFEITSRGLNLYKNPTLWSDPIASGSAEITRLHRTVAYERLRQAEHVLLESRNCEVPSESLDRVKEAATYLARSALIAGHIHPIKGREVDQCASLPDELGLTRGFRELKRILGGFSRAGAVPPRQWITGSVGAVDRVKADLERWLQIQTSAERGGS